jgi:hypothetical protein
MYANKIQRRYFIGAHQIKYVRLYVESGTAMIEFKLANGKTKRARRDGWVDGASVNDPAPDAAQVRASRRTLMEMKAGVRERQGGDFVGLVTTRRV